jgi:hypothetical protein
MERNRRAGVAAAPARRLTGTSCRPVDSPPWPKNLAGNLHFFVA